MSGRPITRSAKTPSVTQGPKGARKADAPLITKKASRTNKTPSITNAPPEGILPAEVKRIILEKKKKEQERNIKKKAASRGFDSEAAGPAAAAPAPSRRRARAGKRPAQPTPDQQEAAATLEGIGAAVIAPAIAPGACPLVGAGPIEFIGGEHYDHAEYEAWLKENRLTDPREFAKFIKGEKERLEAINDANEIYSPVERASAVRQQLNRSAELMVRQLSVNSISRRLYGITAALTHGHLLHFAGATSYINELMDTVIANGGVPEIILDTLAIIRSNRIPDIAVGGVLQSETFMQVAGTLNGMALVRFVMNMNEALLEGVADKELDVMDPSEYNIVKKLTDSNLPLERQLEIIKGFVLKVTNDLMKDVENFVARPNPYDSVLKALSDPAVAGAIRDGAFGYIQEAIRKAATVASDETRLRDQRERMAQAGIDPRFRRADKADASPLPSAKASAFSFGRYLVEDAAAKTLGLTRDLVKVAFLGMSPDPSGAVHRAYHFMASGMYNLYTQVCPSMHGREVDGAFQELVEKEQGEIAAQLTEPEIKAIEETPGSARALEIQRNPEMGEADKLEYFKELADEYRKFLEQASTVDDSLKAFQGSPGPLYSQSLPDSPGGGGRKRKRHSTRSSTSSKSSKSGTRKHGKAKSKRVKRDAVKMRHMRLVPGAGHRTRKHKHSKRGRK